LCNRGNCYRKLGQLDLSIDDLRKAVSADPENVNARNNLGLSYFENKDYEQALTEFNKAISL
jgi:tetratricopeptide (TPR) repeat protein